MTKRAKTVQNIPGIQTHNKTCALSLSSSSSCSVISHNPSVHIYVIYMSGGYQLEMKFNYEYKAQINAEPGTLPLDHVAESGCSVA